MTDAGQTKEQRIHQYGATYLEDHGFESHLVTMRQRLILELLASRLPRVVVEIGCGKDLLFDAVRRGNSKVRDSIRQWVIVEPYQAFAEAARSHHPTSPELLVIGGFLEQVISEVIARCIAPPDLIICASVLHEVDDVSEILEPLRILGKEGGILHVNVPNSNSLHRQLGSAMGIISNPGALSERNVHFQQFRVFNFASLSSTLRDAGFSIIESGGCFLKPFSHAQMEQLPFLTPELLDGLYRLGRELPEIATEIYANVRVAAGGSSS